jgi:hypothetical protein
MAYAGTVILQIGAPTNGTLTLTDTGATNRSHSCRPAPQ